MKENGFKRTKERSRGYSAHTITEADYADYIAPKPCYIVWNEQLLA